MPFYHSVNNLLGVLPSVLGRGLWRRFLHRLYRWGDCPPPSCRCLCWKLSLLVPLLSRPLGQVKGTFPPAPPCISRKELRSHKSRSVTCVHGCSSVHRQLFQGVFQFLLAPLLLNQTQCDLDPWLIDTVFLVRTWRGTGPRIWPGDRLFIRRIKEGTKWINDKPSQFSHLVSIFCIFGAGRRPRCGTQQPLERKSLSCCKWCERAMSCAVSHVLSLPCPTFSSQNTRRHQESRSVTLTVHAHFTFPDLPTLMGIQCGSWTLPIPTVGSYGAASSRPLVLLPSAYAAKHAGNPPPLCSLVLQRQWPGSFIFHCSSLCLLR